MTKAYQKTVDELMPERWSDEDYGDSYDYGEIEEAIREGIKRGIKIQKDKENNETSNNLCPDLHR